MAGKPKSRRGGFLGSLINQAAVPFALVAAQQTYRKKQGGKRTRRRKSVRRSRRHR